jgi:hypothetical protein
MGRLGRGWLADRSPPLSFIFTSVSAPAGSHSTSSYSATTSSSSSTADRAGRGVAGAGSTSIGATGRQPAGAGALPLAAERGGRGIKEMGGRAPELWVRRWAAHATVRTLLSVKRGPLWTGLCREKCELLQTRSVFCVVLFCLREGRPATTRHVQRLLPGTPHQGQGTSRSHGRRSLRRRGWMVARRHGIFFFPMQNRATLSFQPGPPHFYPCSNAAPAFPPVPAIHTPSSQHPSP